MAQIPPDVEARLKGLVQSLCRLFRSPRITIIVRAPDIGNVKGDLVFGNDDPGKALEALRARMVDESTKLFPGTPEEVSLIEKEKTDGGTGPHIWSGGYGTYYQPGKPG